MGDGGLLVWMYSPQELLLLTPLVWCNLVTPL